MRLVPAPPVLYSEPSILTFRLNSGELNHSRKILALIVSNHETGDDCKKLAIKNN